MGELDGNEENTGSWSKGVMRGTGGKKSVEVMRGDAGEVESHTEVIKHNE